MTDEAIWLVLTFFALKQSLASLLSIGSEVWRGGWHPHAEAERMEPLCPLNQDFLFLRNVGGNRDAFSFCGNFWYV